jgi:hypothetical protein
MTRIIGTTADLQVDVDRAASRGIGVCRFREYDVDASVHVAQVDTFRLTGGFEVAQRKGDEEGPFRPVINWRGNSQERDASIFTFAGVRAPEIDHLDVKLFGKLGSVVRSYRDRVGGVVPTLNHVHHMKVRGGRGLLDCFARHDDPLHIDQNNDCGTYEHIDAGEVNTFLRLHHPQAKSFRVDYIGAGCWDSFVWGFGSYTLGPRCTPGATRPGAVVADICYPNDPLVIGGSYENFAMLARSSGHPQSGNVILCPGPRFACDPFFMRADGAVIDLQSHGPLILRDIIFDGPGIPKVRQLGDGGTSLEVSGCMFQGKGAAEEALFFARTPTSHSMTLRNNTYRKKDGYTAHDYPWAIQPLT